MKIYLASDHAGFFYKEKVKEYFLEKKYQVYDFGAKNFDSKDNYVDFVFPCIKEFIKNTNGNPNLGFAFVFGGSGTGEAIVSNKVKLARAALCNSNNFEIVKLSREHNNANVLSFGCRFISEKEMFEALNIFLQTQFEEGRHSQRVLKVNML